MIWAVLAAAAALGLGLCLMHRRISRLMDRLDEMLCAAIDGSFQEREFSETRLSSLEARMARYLRIGMSERKKVAQERDAVQALVSDIAHQTRLPLSNILLYSQLLSEAAELTDDSRALTAQIGDQTEKLCFLLEALVKISRLESGVIQLSPRETSVSALLDGLDFAAAAREKGVELKIDGAEPLCAVFDLKWTLEALSNIVDNAVKYTPEGGEVRVSARAYELFVRVDVKDTGLGMDEAETAKVFARFYRSPRTSQAAGVGLGLYLAREVISREGGYIRVSSALGEGSTFSVFLPRRNRGAEDREDLAALPS